MKIITLSRRTVLAGACQIPTATFLALIAGCTDKKQSVACTDTTGQLTDTETGLRESLQYTDQAPDPATACSTCAYFRRTTETTECGNCQLLNGPVRATGHCASWSAKT